MNSSLTFLAIFVLLTAVLIIKWSQNNAEKKKLNQRLHDARTLEDWQDLYFITQGVDRNTNRLAKIQWDRFALKEVLCATDLVELSRIKSGRLREGSLAEIASVYMQEELAMVEVTLAQDNEEKLIQFATFAPKGNARNIALKRLRTIYTSA